eukprot:c22085_g1_i1 orf=477-659(+)
MTSILPTSRSNLIKQFMTRTSLLEHPFIYSPTLSHRSKQTGDCGDFALAKFYTTEGVALS